MHHSGTVGQSGPPQIFPDQPARVEPHIYKDGPRRSPAQRFNSQLSGSGKQIQHPGARYVELNGAEQRLFSPVPP